MIYTYKTHWKSLYHIYGIFATVIFLSFKTWDKDIIVFAHQKSLNNFLGPFDWQVIELDSNPVSL